MKISNFLGLALACCVVVGFGTPTYAAKEQPVFYEMNGEAYVDVAGKTYSYLTVEDFKPVEGQQIVQMLEASAASALSDPLPVPPTYSYDLANGSYSGSVDLSNGNRWSPLIKRAVPKRYTTSSVDAILTSIGYFYYNAYEAKWYGGYKNALL